MFEPGYYQFEGQDEGGTQRPYNVHIRYQVRVDAVEGPMLHFSISGEADGKKFDDTFELHRDTAFNFASALGHVAAQHGVPVDKGLIMHRHRDYDLMFADIHSLLHLHYGEPINLDHLDSDRI